MLGFKTMNMILIIFAGIMMIKRVVLLKSRLKCDKAICPKHSFSSMMNIDILKS